MKLKKMSEIEWFPFTAPCVLMPRRVYMAPVITVTEIIFFYASRHWDGAEDNQKK